MMSHALIVGALQKQRFYLKIPYKHGGFEQL